MGKIAKMFPLGKNDCKGFTYSRINAPTPTQIFNQQLYYAQDI